MSFDVQREQLSLSVTSSLNLTLKQRVHQGSIFNNILARYEEVAPEFDPL